MFLSNIGNKETMSRNLSYYIEKTGKTQKELAELVGVATSTFNNWVKGNKYPRIDKIEMLANYFGILKSDLIEEKEKPTVQNDGLSEKRKALIDFARSVPEEKAEMILRIMKSILEDD